MPAIVEFPTVVQDAVTEFGDLFACEPQRTHFAEYLTGLFVARNKTVSGIQREFPQAADQSCLNRFLTEAAWDENRLNERRLERLQRDAETQYSPAGVIAIDNVLIDHHGKLIADVGWFWDHAEDRNKLAHDYVFVNYVCPNRRHYPLEFRRFKKRDACEADGVPFVNHTRLVMDLIDWTAEREIPGDFTFDSYFTCAEVLNHIYELPALNGRRRHYVGDLKLNRKIWSGGKEISAQEWATSIDPSQRRELRRGESRQWYSTRVVHVPGVWHAVRLVAIWRHRRDKTPCKILITSGVTWEVRRITKTYELRWTGTETFHRDGKQELGMGDCQLRSSQGQTRHMYLVMLAYSLLVEQLHHRRSRSWTSSKLMTIGDACLQMSLEVLRTTLTWAVEKVAANPKKLPHLMELLALI